MSLTIVSRSRKNLIAYAACVGTLMLSLSAKGMPADPRPFEYTQPDGSKVWLRLRGDEFFDWTEDLQGFTVIRDKGRYVYATLAAEGTLAASSFEAGKVDPARVGLVPGVLPVAEKRGTNLNGALQPYRPWIKAAGKSGAKINVLPNGIVKNLVILCMFSDHNLATHTRTQSEYGVLFNQLGGDVGLAPTGSVRDVFRENSYGVLDLQSSIVAWVTLPETEAYYAGNNNGRPYPPNACIYPESAEGMVEDALNLADSLVNFADFDQDNDGYVDAICFIHSGYGAEQGGSPANRIWSHKWFLPTVWSSKDKNVHGDFVKVSGYHTEPALWGINGRAITHIGVIAHETGHYFGLPDLYDISGNGWGVGSWCIMANSWGFDGDQLHPPHFSAWCKEFLQWAQPIMLSNPGTYSLTQVESAPQIYKITQGFRLNEYLLIENRQPVGLESDIPQGGLAIWHIDNNTVDNSTRGYPGQSGWPDNGKHYKVALLQADGLYDLEKKVNQGDAGDLYRSTASLVIGLNTVPSADTYQGGRIVPTFNVISNVSSPGGMMLFDYARPPSLYVNKDYTGTIQHGSTEEPYRKVGDAYAAAHDGDTIVVRANQYFEAPLNFLTSKRVILNSHRGAAVVH